MCYCMWFQEVKRNSNMATFSQEQEGAFIEGNNLFK